MAISKPLPLGHQPSSQIGWGDGLQFLVVFKASNLFSFLLLWWVIVFKYPRSRCHKKLNKRTPHPTPKTAPAAGLKEASSQNPPALTRSIATTSICPLVFPSHAFSLLIHCPRGSHTVKPATVSAPLPSRGSGCWRCPAERWPWVVAGRSRLLWKVSPSRGCMETALNLQDDGKEGGRTALRGLVQELGRKLNLVCERPHSSLLSHFLALAEFTPGASPF